MSSDSPAAIKSDDHNFAREMLAQIAFVRAFEQKAWDLTMTKPPSIDGSMHFCAGQEAVPLGALSALGEQDRVIATYRGHGWALACGLDPDAVFAEIAQRAGGINGGRGGSAYMMAPGTRFIGENSIVGAGTTIACGVAMAQQSRGADGVTVVTIGDGALNQGGTHEALAFAAARSLPVIFVVENNGWSEMTATSAMFKLDRLAKRAAGYGIASATIDGTDPMIVRDSVAMAADRARKGEGPSLLECRVPRLWGHYNKDIEHYRPKSDRTSAERADPLDALAERLVAARLMTAGETETLIAREGEKVDEMARAVMISALPDGDRIPATLSAASTLSRPATVETREMSYIEAVNLALRTELETDQRTLVYGEDVGKAGGIFGASRYLQRDFGADRVFDTPVAENAILGSAVGAALAGMKPIVEIMWADFLFVAIDQLINQAANVRFMTDGAATVPMVVRTQQGATPGSCAQHSQSIEAILAHVPGLKLGLAASATDAYALLRAAAADPDPCIIIEARKLYLTKADVAITEGVEPVGVARRRRDGHDLAILSWGAMVPIALEAAEQLSNEGIEAGVLDLRWLNPLDRDAIVEVVKGAGGNVLIAHEAVRTGGFAGELAMRLGEWLPGLKLDVQRVTTPDTRIPASPVLQEALIPDAVDIASAARTLVASKRARDA
ncbi:alpha-ketoacid dehydrogenase subunit alpha/beta [Oricola indica]|uniref:alpha-ketoacid dehydrogenase subunit alpha/beta n=1 Tax=Oricola indica TaxID=2872591 RepID=UPI003CCBB632